MAGDGKKTEIKVVELCEAVVSAKDRETFRKAMGRLSTYLAGKQKRKKTRRLA